jgi:hypothetical protein
MFARFCSILSRTDPGDRKLLLFIAQKMSRSKSN